MIETSTGPPQSLRRHSEPLKAQTGSVLNVPIAALQHLIRAGNVEARGCRHRNGLKLIESANEYI